jgi:UDP-N-acetylmuramoyl-tripeptide--D-alanyl-D-alanine ligase
MLTIAEAAVAVGGLVDGADVRFSRVGTDTRTLVPGDLFVALRGERYDGHDFVQAALDRGAVAAMVDRAYAPAAHQRLLRVDDTRAALGALASYWRARHTLPVIAVTGSNGKTTVKEMLAAILRQAVKSAGTDGAADGGILATSGNLNNDIGVPLTLLRMRSHHRYAVIEMGMNHSGELTYLSGLARPDVALVNNAQRAHIGHFADVVEVARAKAEIYAGLASDGIALVNADDPNAPLFRESAGQHLRLEFGFDADADVRARTWLQGIAGSRMEVDTPAGPIEIALELPGEHNARNALAACAAAIAVDVPATAIAGGLAAFRGVPGRLQRRDARGGAQLIDDTYNANPDSMRAALEVLARQPGSTVFVVGDMGEIGSDGPALHEEIGAHARALGIGACHSLGDLSARTSAVFGPAGHHYADVDTLVAALVPTLAPGITVLVKGSRFMRMERVVEALAAPSGES